MDIPRIVILMLIILKTNAVILKNGGYEDVYVLIQENNKESDQLIQRIQDVLTDTSRLLFTATHNQLYFRKIKIIVPKTWTQRQNIKQIPIPPLKDSFLIVDNGNIPPQAKGKSECGKTRSYMYLPQNFIMNSKRTRWGLHDRVILHEWGHLRWGLFDELPTKGNTFYMANGRWNPTRCTSEIDGVIWFKPKKRKAKPNECDITDTSRPMPTTCAFRANDRQDADASIMSYPFIDKMSQFCDDDNPSVKKEHRHQSFAQTRHNIACNYRSAWDVMRNHSDFQNIKQLPASTNTTPTFEIIQETTNYRLFVLDVSGSMKDFGRLKTLQQATENVIQLLISKGSWVGIVSFSTTAKVKKVLTQVNTQQDRDALIQAIPTIASGWTCIGCGLREATKMLTKKLGDIAYGEIVLISDGENSPPEKVDVDVNIARKEVIDAKITVHAIAVSQQADHLLGDIARETGGRYYTYLDSGGISLLGAFSQTISSSQTSARKKNVMLMAHKMDSVKSKQHNISFAIEEGLGDDTSFTFITPKDTIVRLQLTGPDGYYQIKQSNGSITTLLIPGTAKAGKYEMTATTGTLPRAVEYYVKSDAHSDDIISMTSWLSTNDIDLSTDDLPIIFSEVSKGHLPVLNATVIARVETGDHSCDIRLKDDGIDADNFIEDGTYSGYILPTCLHPGRVNIKVEVKGKKGETLVLQSVSGAPSQEEGEEHTEYYNSSFQRVEVLEQLNVINYPYTDTSSSDLIAPGKITDVSIHNIQSKASNKDERRNFTISWTATGDDKSIGRAASYIFRIADDFEDLLHNFDNATLLEVTNTSLIPKQSGETEALKIIVDAEEKFTGTAFFAVQAVDEAGNKGGVSNIISIVVAKGYRAFSEEGTLEIDNSDMVSSAQCYHILSVFAIASLYFIFNLMCFLEYL